MVSDVCKVVRAFKMIKKKPEQVPSYRNKSELTRIDS